MPRRARPTHAPPGVYDEPLTRALEDALAALGAELVVTSALEAHYAPVALGRVVHERVVSALGSLKGEDKPSASSS